MPRFASEQAAAAELGIELATFRHLRTIGRIPAPDPVIGLYDLKALDAAFDRMAGIGAPENALEAWLEKRANGHDQA